MVSKYISTSSDPYVQKIANSGQLITEVVSTLWVIVWVSVLIKMVTFEFSDGNNFTFGKYHKTLCKNF